MRKSKLDERECRKCEQVFPASREHFGSNPQGGLRRVCRSCMNAYSKSYDAQNKTKKAARDQKRTQSTPGARESFRSALKTKLWNRQSGMCLCCFNQIDRPDSGEGDHVTPVARGGVHDESNWLLTHPQCNREKHNKTLEEHWAWRLKTGLDRPDAQKRNIAMFSHLIPR